MILGRSMHRIGYLFFACMILTIGTILFLLNSTKVLQWTAERYAPRYHLGYTEVSGTLLTGFEVEGLTFKDEILLDNLKADWNPASILYNRLTFTSFEANGLHVETAKTAVDTFHSVRKQNEKMFVMPVILDVEELKLSVNPFTQSGVKFKAISLNGTDIVLHDEAIDIADLSFSIDTNVTKIELSGGIQDKHINIKDFRILDVDTVAFNDVIKRMAEIRLQEKVVETVEPEIEHYRAGRENYIPKSVSIDSAIITLKRAEHSQIRLNQAEMKIDALKADIYKMLEYRPNTVQVDSLSVKGTKSH